MKIIVDFDKKGLVNRKAKVEIFKDELSAVYLHLSSPEKRNRTELYMRRHPHFHGESVGPNSPLRAPEAPPKITIPQHIEEMRKKGMISTVTEPLTINGDTFRTLPVMIAVPISDTVANLLRPCFHINGFGEYKLFHFKNEPIKFKTYWCACFLKDSAENGHLEFRNLRFDSKTDSIMEDSKESLIKNGFVWAAATIPLVINGKSLSPVEIAQNDYDLRQIIGRQEEDKINHIYDGWFKDWEARVKEIVLEHETNGLPFESFYHSILAVDNNKNIHIRQLEGTLPGIAKSLAEEGIHNAGLLDSGGSCAIYDVGLENYLNRSWYYREPRGSILVFQLKSKIRIPESR